MNIDGSDQQRLTDSPGIDRGPAVSPDGARIAFISDREGDLDVYVMNADGTDQRSLARAAGNEDEPTWSPDGSRIACTVLMGQFRSIRIAGADGSDVRTLAHGQTTDLNSIRFSPDGSQMAGAFSEYGDSGIVVLDLESGKLRKLLKVPSLKPHPQGWYTTGTNQPRMVAKTFSGVSFSPDGQRLVYCSDQSDDGQFMLYTISLPAEEKEGGGEEGKEKPEKEPPKPTPVPNVVGAWPMTTDWAK
jgi:TolB protein